MHCCLLRDELAEMQQRLLAALPIHKYRCAAENAIAVRYSLHALSRHVKLEEMTNMKQLMELSLRTHTESLCRELHAAVVQQNMGTFGRLLARYYKWSQNVRGLCGVRPAMPCSRDSSGIFPIRH